MLGRLSLGPILGDPPPANKMPTHPLASQASSYTENAFECDSPQVMLGGGHGALSDDGASTSNNQPHLQLGAGGGSELDASDAIEYGEIARPWPEIILRWKRFALLILLAAGGISCATYGFYHGIYIMKVAQSEVESKVNLINTYSGIVMGFAESFLGLLLEHLFPVFIVYLHNLKWFPGDNPAVKSNRIKKSVLMLFVPIVMVSLGNSFSALQANDYDVEDSNATASISSRHLQQFEDETQTLWIVEHSALLPLEETVLRSAMLPRGFTPFGSSTCSLATDSNVEEALTTATVAFGFPLKSWNRDFYSESGDTKRVSFSLNSNMNVKSDDVMPISMAFELLLQGKMVFDRSLAEARSPTDQQRQDSLTAIQQIAKYLNDVDTMSKARLLDEIRRSFLLPSAANADQSVTVTLEQTSLGSQIDLHAMTIQISTAMTSMDINSTLCGAHSCIALDTDAASSLPRSQISMAKYVTSCSTDAIKTGADIEWACERESNAAFLFGITSEISADFIDETSSLVNARRTMTLSFSKLLWRIDKIEPAICEQSSTLDCMVLHHKLNPSGQYLAMLPSALPATLDQADFAHAIRLVQLLQPKTLTGNKRAIVQRLSMQQSADFSGDECSSVVDAYLHKEKIQHLYIQDRELVQTMYASGLMYLFQNAVLMEPAISAQAALARRLATSTSTNTTQVYVSNTNVGNVSTWIGCGVLLILTMVVLIIPNERARLEPPKGSNARADRFIAVQTEQIYPNLVYKKRFLIGKTGEEIKFREFSVESVKLHHKMEEDETIYL